MAYTKQTWADLPSKTTPINAERLTHIEDGIFNAAQTADTAASTAGTAAANVGIVSGRVETLTERVNGLDTAVSNKVDKVAGKGLSTNDYDDTDKGKVDSLGTASTKNSTSVVTESSDLVESGAVKDIVGWGNKNLFNKNDVENGIIDESGAIAIVGEWKSSKFIKVTPSEKYIISGLNISYSSSAGFAFYNSAKTFVSGGGINVFKNTPITIPDNVEYIRFSLVPADLDTAQLEVGSTATAYEPYHASVEGTIPQVVSDAVGWIGDNLFGGNLKNGQIGGDGIYVSGSNRLCNVSQTQENVFFLKKGTYTISADNLDSVTAVIKGDNYSIINNFATSWNALPFTFTTTQNGYLYFTLKKNDNSDLTPSAYNARVKHITVDEQKCDNSVIGTVEGANASKAWSVGEHFINGGQFKEVTQAIASGGAISDSNTVNKPIADCLLRLLPIFNNAGSHNGIFRGKNLGSSLTTAQKTAIANGSFEDLYIGDYWEINSIKWRIVHFDYWLNSGDGNNVCTDHHVVVVPDSALVNKRMNAKVDNVDTTAGAYVNSEMRTTNLADAKTIVNAAFGADNILTHKEYLQNAVTDGYESGGAWLNADIELMSEIMVYGSNIFHNISNGTAQPNNYTINKTQLALFRLDPSYIICKNVAQTDRSHWWLRDVVSATNFAFVYGDGLAAHTGASYSIGVRPAFGIK